GQHALVEAVGVAGLLFSSFLLFLLLRRWGGPEGFGRRVGEPSEGRGRLLDDFEIVENRRRDPVGLQLGSRGRWGRRPRARGGGGGAGLRGLDRGVLNVSVGEEFF